MVEQIARHDDRLNLMGSRQAGQSSKGFDDLGPPPVRQRPEGTKRGIQMNVGQMEDSNHTAATSFAYFPLNAAALVEWPGSTFALGSMKWTALLTAIAASPKPVEIRSSLPS